MYAPSTTSHNWEAFNGLTVLVTGGTGSFGKLFIKTLLENCDVAKIIVYSRDEFKQSLMQSELADARVSYFIGDVRSLERLREALRDVDCVVHAAAMKQVPASEEHPYEAVATNIGGTANVTQACIDCGVQRLITLSTDKAVAAVNLYGATKFVGDKLVLAANSKNGLVSSVVRYGNVLGSRGSVIPYFRQLRSEGKPLTVTRMDMTRFWMPLSSAVGLVCDAMHYCSGGEILTPVAASSSMRLLVEALFEDCVVNDLKQCRPGEKVHEQLISPEMAVNTYLHIDENFYVTMPDGVLPTGKDLERGYPLRACARVAPDFSYTSLNNPRLYQTADNLRDFLIRVGA